jgi:hypothetical protein
MDDEVTRLSEELKKVREQTRSDRKLIERAASALAEIDRGPGLDDVHVEVLAALRIRLEGKPRASLEDLLTAVGDIKGTKDLGDVLAGGEPSGSTEWPEVIEKTRDWPQH